MKKKLSVIMAAAMMTSALTPVISNASTSISKNGREYMIRYSGSNRFDTAVDVSKGNFSENTKNLIIVNGMNPADALSGGPLAAKLNAPILLTESYRISDNTLKEIARLNPSNVYILGGNNSVSKSVEGKIKAKLKSDAKLIRISGADRYETSVKIADEITGSNRTKGAGFVNGATSKFPDALGAAALLGSKDMPLILTNGSVLPSGTEGYKKNSNNYIIGGTNSINIYGLSGKRLAGLDRYGTCAAVANEGFKDQLYDYSKSENASKFNAAVIVDGRNYPDALTAISVSKKNNAPILLVNGIVPNTISNYMTKERRDRGYIVGGANSVTISVQNSILNILEENYKYNRNGENLKIRTAIRNLDDNMKKMDKYIALLSKTDKNKVQIDDYKTERDSDYNLYLKSGARLGDVTEDMVKNADKNLDAKFKRAIEADENAVDRALSTQIIDGLSKLNKADSPYLSSDAKKNHDDFRKLINDGNDLLKKSGKNMEKLEKALAIKDFNLKSDSSSTTEENKTTDDYIRKAEKLRDDSDDKIANGKMGSNEAYKKASSELRYALKKYQKDKTDQNRDKLKSETDAFEIIYNCYDRIEKEVERIDKFDKDSKEADKTKFKTEKFKDVNLSKERETLNNQKGVLNNIINLGEELEVVIKMSEQTDKEIKNANEKQELYKYIKENIDSEINDADKYIKDKGIKMTSSDKDSEKMRNFKLNYEKAVLVVEEVIESNIAGEGRDGYISNASILKNKLISAKYDLNTALTELKNEKK